MFTYITLVVNRRAYLSCIVYVLYSIVQKLEDV